MVVVFLLSVTMIIRHHGVQGGTQDGTKFCVMFELGYFFLIEE